jgi:hypothetical protein
MTTRLPGQPGSRFNSVTIEMSHVAINPDTAMMTCRG